MPEVAAYEPRLALYAGQSGLDLYARISNEAKPFLTPRGLLILEVGHSQAKAVIELFCDDGWIHERTVVDLSGVDRVVVFR